MEAIETETLEHNGQAYRIRIFHDPDAGKPLEECDGMGTIKGLNRRHANFDPTGVEDAIENSPGAIPLIGFRARAVPRVDGRGMARGSPLASARPGAPPGAGSGRARQSAGYPPSPVTSGPAPGLDSGDPTAAAVPVKLPRPLSAGGSLRPFAGPSPEGSRLRRLFKVAP
jgi:hypothetical protein